MHNRRIHCRSALARAVFLAVAGLSAQPSFGDAILRPLILSGQIGLQSGIVDGRADGAFDDFVAPVIGPTGLIAFEGSVLFSPDDNAPETPESRAGIWVVDANTGQMRLVMMSGMAAPGTPGVFSTGFSEVRVDALGNVMFDASGLTGTAALAYYHATPSGVLKQVALQTAQVPNAPGLTFGDIRNGTGFVNNGHMVINEPVQGAATGTAALRWDGTALTTIVHPGMAVPNAPAGTIFGSTTALVTSSGNHLLLTSTRLNTTVTPGYWRHEAGVLTPVVQVNDIMPGIPFFEPRFTALQSADINNAGQVAFSGSGNDASFDFAAIYRTSASGLQRVVTSGDNAPGSAGSFFNFSTTAINGQGNIAFLGLAVTNGLWIARAPANQTTFGLTSVAVVNQSLTALGDPLLPANGVFATLTGAFNFNALDQLAFLAKIGGTGVNTTNDDTLWFYDPVDGLKLIARENSLFVLSPTDSRIVRTIEFIANGGGGQDGRPSGLSDNGLLTFSLAFTDNSDGIFLYGPPPTGNDFYWRANAFSNNWHALLSGDSNWRDELNNVRAVPPGGAPTDKVFVDVVPPAGIILDQQHVIIGSIQFPNGSLTLRKSLQVNANSMLDDVVLDGIESEIFTNATLTLTGMVDWKQGEILGGADGLVISPVGGEIKTTSLGDDLVVHTLGVNLNSHGVFDHGALLGLDALLTIENNSQMFLRQDAIVGDGSILLRGNMHKLGAAGGPNHIELFVPVNMDDGTIEVSEGTLTLAKSAVHDGEYLLKPGGTLIIALDPAATITVDGSLVARRPFLLGDPPNSPAGMLRIVSGNFLVAATSFASFALIGEGVRLEGGVLGGAGGIGNDADMHWTGGRIENSGAIFDNDGHLRIAELDGQSVELRGRLTNQGTVTQGSVTTVHQGGNFTLSGATIRNEGQWNLLGGIFLLAGTPSTFQNDGGIFNVHVDTILSFPFHNSLAGELRVHGVPFKLTQPASHTGSGAFVLIPGAEPAKLTITGPQTFTGQHEIRGTGDFAMQDTTLTLAGGTLTYNLSQNSLPAFDNITLAGAGLLQIIAPVEIRKINVDGGHIRNENSHIELLGETFLQNQGDIKNNGLMEINDDITLQTGAKFFNLAGGVLEIDVAAPTGINLEIQATELTTDARFINQGGRIEIKGAGFPGMIFDIPVDFIGGSVESLDPIVHFLRDLNVSAPATFSTAAPGHISIGATQDDKTTNTHLIGGTRFDGQGSFLLHNTLLNLTGGDVSIDLNGDKQVEFRNVTTSGPGRLVIVSRTAILGGTVGNLLNRVGSSNPGQQLRFATNSTGGPTLKDSIVNQGRITLEGTGATLDPTLHLINESTASLTIDVDTLTLHAGAKLTNQGKMLWNKPTNPAIDARPLTLSNTGTLELGPAAHLTLESSRTAQFAPSTGGIALTGGTWILHAASRLTVTTGESITQPLARSQATLNFHGNGKIDNLIGAFHNQGSMSLLEGTHLVLTGSFKNDGTLNIDAASSLTTLFLDNDGITRIHGKVISTMNFSTASSFTGFGTLQGSGTSGGTVSPGNTPGILTVTDDFTFLSTALLEIELAGLDPGIGHDQFAVGDIAALDGTLKLLFLDGFESQIAPADEFQILTAATIIGQFANAPDGQRLLTHDGLGSFIVDYTPTSITLTSFQAVPEPTSLTLLLPAALALLTRRRRRRN